MSKMSNLAIDFINQNPLIKKLNMQIIKIISEHKRKLKNNPPMAGYKRVMAVVLENGIQLTRHLDIKI